MPLSTMMVQRTLRALPTFSRRTTALLKGLATAAIIAVSCPAQASFSDCLNHFPQKHVPQLPAGFAHSTRALCFDGFAILYSGTSKTPVYAIERLTSADFADVRKRKRGRNPFYPEARLPAHERSSLDDYKAVLPDGSRMDRGHVVPAGDMTTAESFAQTFSLANMVPQVPRANQGPWNQIEQDTRHFVRRAKGAVFIFTGPVFDRRPQRLGPGQVWIPEAMFKLVYDTSSNRAWAHWLANHEDARVQRPISYEELVNRTGIRFLPFVPED